MLRTTALKWLGSVVGFMTAASVHAALITFTDNTFTPANYSSTTFVNDTSSTPVAITFGQSAGTGNPAPSWQVKFVQAPRSTLNLNSSMQGFINSTFLYNPLVNGAILGLSFSNNRFVDLGATLNPGVSVNSRILIKQGSNYFIDVFVDPQIRQAWYTSATSLQTAANFNLYDFATDITNAAVHPDFSAAGGLINFGFASRLSAGGFPAGTLPDSGGIYGFDNLSISLTTQPRSVPEPVTLALLGLGLAGLAFGRRKQA